MTASLASALASSDLSPFLFPDELLGEIFFHCDAPSLAALSRASFACLELTSKLPYTDVVLEDGWKMLMLFRLKNRHETIYPTSDRVSGHTFLSLIHTFTLHDRGDMCLPLLDWFTPFPPPLSVEVLAVSLATSAVYTARGQDTLPVVDLRPILDLFNPRVFLLHGRRAPLFDAHPDLARGVSLGAGSPRATSRPWTRLSTFVQGGVHLSIPDLLVLRGMTTNRTPRPPLQIVWDLLDFRTTRPETMRRTFAYSTLVNFCGFLKGELAGTQRVLAWVGSEEVRNALRGSGCDHGNGAEREDVAYDVSGIPSDRVRRLREAFVEHGVRKDMDWAALDDL